MLDLLVLVLRLGLTRLELLLSLCCLLLSLELLLALCGLLSLELLLALCGLLGLELLLALRGLLLSLRRRVVVGAVLRPVGAVLRRRMQWQREQNQQARQRCSPQNRARDLFYSTHLCLLAKRV